MTSKRVHIVLGVLLILAAVFFFELTMALVSRHCQELIPYISICAFFSAILFCLAEFMFIRAKIVPKVLRIIIYVQWAIWGSALLIITILLVFGERMGYFM